MNPIPSRASNLPRVLPAVPVFYSGRDNSPAASDGQGRVTKRGCSAFLLSWVARPQRVAARCHVTTLSTRARRLLQSDALMHTIRIGSAGRAVASLGSSRRAYLNLPNARSAPSGGVWRCHRRTQTDGSRQHGIGEGLSPARSRPNSTPFLVAPCWVVGTSRHSSPRHPRNSPDTTSARESQSVSTPRPSTSSTRSVSRPRSSVSSSYRSKHMDAVSFAHQCDEGAFRHVGEASLQIRTSFQLCGDHLDDRRR